MNDAPSNAFGRALARARSGFDGFTRQPGAFQLAGIAAVFVTLGPLLPWVDYDFGGDESGDYVLGVEIASGMLSVLTGVTMIVLLDRQIRSGAEAASGYVPAVGLLAVLLVGAELIHVYDSGSQTPGWGLYVSGAAAGLLLLAAVALFGGVRSRRPPD